MNEQLRESLSSLMDGEASEQDIQRVLENLQNPAVRSAWQSYNMARWSLGGDIGPGSDELTARIMAAVESEPAHSYQPQGDAAVDIKPVGAWHRFSRPLASFAVAASVFAVVLLGSQFVGEGVGQADPVTADRASPTGMVNTLGGAAVRAGYATPVQRVAPAPASDYNAIARERLQRYMLQHTDEAALNAPQGMMPYARVATFRVEE